MFIEKILCIGCETLLTDSMVSELVVKNNTINHGLISDKNFVPEQYGYYHTSVVDLTPGSIVKIANLFDKIIMLDQPKESYPHYKSIVSTVRLMMALEDEGFNVVYRDNAIASHLLYWKNLLAENKSFCFYPFLGLIDNVGNYTTICPKSTAPIKSSKDIVNWVSDAEYSNIRQKMIRGEQMPERCSNCYNSERMGFESARQFETLEWAELMSFNTVEDFLEVKDPALFEIRPSNKCNVMCRICAPNWSHLIEKEYKKINISINSDEIHKENWSFSNTDYDKINFSSAKRIYFGGGEPTVMPEFYDFLRKCIEKNNTNFELLIGTNGMKFSNVLLDLLDHFDKVCLAVSYDGYKKVNDYIRWLTNFDTMIENTRILRERGHKISLQTVFSIWNLPTLYKIFEFYDQEYPGSTLLVQPAGEINSLFGPYNHPCPELVIESMKRCQQTQIYYENGRSIKSMVDAILNYYSNPDYKCNLDLLKKFFEFNDKLDKSRNCKLEDYVPELAEARIKYFGNK